MTEAWKPNRDHTVAVSTTYYWQPIESCPQGGQKVQLLSRYGVAVYGSYNGEDHGFWTHWAPLPRKPGENTNAHEQETA